MNATDSGDQIVKEILIDAPAERVFAALADPEQRVKWWGVPGKFQATHMESDLRPGGSWVMRGTGPGGRPFTLRGEYVHVQPPTLLEFTWLDDGQPDIPVSVVRFDLNQTAGATAVRLTHSGFTSDKARSRYQGWPLLLGFLKNHAEASIPR